MVSRETVFKSTHAFLPEAYQYAVTFQGNKGRSGGIGLLLSSSYKTAAGEPDVRKQYLKEEETGR